MLQVVPDGVAVGHESERSSSLEWETCAPDQDHLLLELARLVVLRADLPVEVQHLLDLLVPTRQHELDDGHQQRRLGVAVQSRDDDPPEGVELELVRAAFESRAHVLRGVRFLSVIMDECVARGVAGRHAERVLGLPGACRSDPRRAAGGLGAAVRRRGVLPGCSWPCTCFAASTTSCELVVRSLRAPGRVVAAWKRSGGERGGAGSDSPRAADFAAIFESGDERD